ncbi:MAG: PKD domain-containing protein, partial [Bacteroidales bacterium]|nr:PKD domain-containing protein [Bacteroidales bacterium]
WTTYTFKASFYGCIYNGVPISSASFGYTSMDIDLRIYEASTVSSNVSGVSWALDHPLLTPEGMIFDSTNYMYVPGYLSYGNGNTTIFTLNRSAFWRSGLAVASRTWFNVSNNPSGSQWNITASKWGYAVNSTEVWSGTNAVINLTVPSLGTSTPPGLEDSVALFTYIDGTYGEQTANYTWGDDAFAFGQITWNADINNVFCNLTLESTTATIDWISNVSYDFTDGVAVDTDTLFGVGISYDTSLLANGTYTLVITFEQENITLTTLAGQFAVLAALIPGIEDTAFVGTYNSLGDFQVNYTWDIEDIEVAGGVTFTYDVPGCYVNLTVREAAGPTVLWLGNYTEDYAAGVAITFTVTAGGAIIIDTTDLVNGSYVVVASFEHASITDTEIFGGFAVIADLIPGFEDDCRLWTYAAGPDYRSNFTRGEAVIYGYLLESTYEMLGDVTTFTVETIAGAVLLTPASLTLDFAPGITEGGVGTFATTALPPDTYILACEVVHADLDTFRIETWFSVGYHSLPFINASAYDSNLTTAANLTDRFDWNQTAYFNGTIGTTYDTANAVINITIGNVTTWLETLWNGTHSFTGGTNESLTDICGDVLNYTCNLTGNWTLKIMVYHASFLNLTIVTEGFTVWNCTDYINNTYVSGTRYILPAFFEYRNRPNRVVEFRDCSKEANGVYVVKVMWSFGDGTTGNGLEIEHTYAMPGIYNTTASVYFSDGTIQQYSALVEVTADVISWWAYAIFSCLVFVGILAVGVYAARHKSKRVLAAMWAMLGLFVAITVIIMQFAVE